MIEPGQEPEEQKLRLDAETIGDLTPREDESADVKGGKVATASMDCRH